MIGDLDRRWIAAERLAGADDPRQEALALAASGDTAARQVAARLEGGASLAQALGDAGDGGELEGVRRDGRRGLVPLGFARALAQLDSAARPRIAGLARECGRAHAVGSAARLEAVIQLLYLAALVVAVLVVVHLGLPSYEAWQRAFDREPSSAYLVSTAALRLLFGPLGLLAIVVLAALGYLRRAALAEVVLRLGVVGPAFAAPWRAVVMRALAAALDAGIAPQVALGAAAEIAGPLAARCRRSAARMTAGAPLESALDAVIPADHAALFTSPGPAAEVAVSLADFYQRESELTRRVLSLAIRNAAIVVGLPLWIWAFVTSAQGMVELLAR